jgi:DNA-binding response OmpR family regulator
MDNLKKTILIIEDDAKISKAYSDGLRRKGFNVLNAKSGDEGLKSAEKEEPNLMMLDLILPDIPGEMILKKMNESGIINKIPVIVLTNKADEASRHNCLQVLGASDYLIKADYTIEGIARKINDILKEA